MEQYRTWLDVRFPDDDGEYGPWQRYDKVMDPYYSQAPSYEQLYDDDSMWLPGTPEERAKEDLDEALGDIIDEQYLPRVVRDGFMDVRVRLVEVGSDDTDFTVVAVCTPSHEEKARAYLASAVRGYDQVRSDLRGRLLNAHRAGVDRDDLIRDAAGRIEADEVHALLKAGRLADVARDVIDGWEDPEGRTSVFVENNNSVRVLLRTSFEQDIQYEEMFRRDADVYENCEDGDPWGYKEGVRNAEALLGVLTKHFTVTCGSRPATPSDLAPLDPARWGCVRITPKTGSAAQ